METQQTMAAYIDSESGARARRGRRRIIVSVAMRRRWWGTLRLGGGWVLFGRTTLAKATGFLSCPLGAVQVRMRMLVRLLSLTRLRLLLRLVVLLSGSEVAASDTPEAMHRGLIFGKRAADAGASEAVRKKEALKVLEDEDAVLPGDERARAGCVILPMVLGAASMCAGCWMCGSGRRVCGVCRSLVSCVVRIGRGFQ